VKEGAPITHMIKHVIPFTKRGEQSHIAFGLTKALLINTLCGGLGFQINTKMKIDFATQKVESALLQASFDLTCKEARHTHPDQVQSEQRAAHPKCLLRTKE
jgi:hypothetical protein